MSIAMRKEEELGLEFVITAGYALKEDPISVNKG